MGKQKLLATVLVLCFVASVICVTFAGKPQDLNDELLEIAGMINGDEAFHHVVEFADDYYEGIYAGTTKCNEAANYIAGKFADYGLEPFGDDETYLDDELFQFKQEEFGYESTGRDMIDATLLAEARRKFDKVYGPKRVGWVLNRMGLKYSHETRGNKYCVTILNLDDLSQRFGLRIGREVPSDQKLQGQGLIDKLHEEFKRGTQQDFEDLVIKYNEYNKELFDKLVGDGSLCTELRSGPREPQSPQN